ncbi:MAG: right-handed parallel beta-helix repeat-containing protein [Pirellulaceae bacterium]
MWLNRSTFNWVLVLSVSLGPLVRAEDIYVNNVAGDDLNNGASAILGGKRVGPFRTIARAIREAGPGDRIVLEKNDEPYRESITIESDRRSGFPDRPFEIVGNGAILDGSQRVPTAAWTHVSGKIYRFRPRAKSHQVLFLDGKPLDRVHVGPQLKEPPKLNDLQWCLFAGQVYFCVEAGDIPQSYDMSHSVLPVGLTLYRVRHVRISNVVFQGFQLDGVNAHDGVSQTELLQLTCRGNGRSGISVGGASKVVVNACLIGDNGTAQLRVEGVSHTRLIDSDLIDDDHAPEVERNGGKVERSNSVAEVPRIGAR